MLVFHFFEFIPQFSKCWSSTCVFLPAFHHYSIPKIALKGHVVSISRSRGDLMMIVSGLRSSHGCYQGFCSSKILNQREKCLVNELNKEKGQRKYAVFSDTNHSVFSVFLSSYRNSPESLGKLQKTVVALACRFVFPQHFLFSKLPLVFL